MPRSLDAVTLAPPPKDLFGIQQTLLAQTTGIASKDELFRSAFSDDVVTTFAKWIDPLDDLDALATFMDALHRDLDGSADRITNFYVLSFEANQAVVRTYVHALLVKAGDPGGDSFDVYASYEDTLRRGANGWRVVKKHCVQLFDTGSAGVLAFDEASQAVTLCA